MVMFVFSGVVGRGWLFFDFFLGCNYLPLTLRITRIGNFLTEK